MGTKSTLAAMTLTATLAACAAPPAPDGSAARVSAPLRLEQYFLGASFGRGVFRPAIAGSPRAFTVGFKGTLRDGVLTLDEDIRYADGECERKQWLLTPTPQGYTGRRDDLVGLAEGRRDGADVLLDYQAAIGSGPSPTVVRFQDRLSPVKPGVVLNRAVVSKFGVKVGEVEITIRK